LEDNINKLIPKERIEQLDRLDNPLIALKQMRRQDDDVRNWLKFALDAAKKDKRNRKNFDYKSYFDLYKEEWSNLLKKRNIELRLDYQAEGTIRAFDIDMDSIFNNLIINSIESFINMKDNRARVVDIKVRTDHNSFIMEYYDSGSGLSPDLSNPEQIFEPLFTTKLNHHTGDAVGTGLGMWIVKMIVTEDYSGSVTLLYPKIGFGVRIAIPMREKDV
jgi:signal transduction histidine kinase